MRAGANGLVWTEAELNTYLLDPRKHMPGNKMAFAGLKEDQDRLDLIAYLKTYK
jgi:cytochrome c